MSNAAKKEYINEIRERYFSSTKTEKSPELVNKHLQEIYAKNGQEVNQDTKLARLCTPKEAKKQGGSFDHLHLEIRKSFYDYGCASWLTMTNEELNKYFYNPMDFMKKNLGVLNNK